MIETRLYVARHFEKGSKDLRLRLSSLLAERLPASVGGHWEVSTRRAREGKIYRTRFSPPKSPHPPQGPGCSARRSLSKMVKDEDVEGLRRGAQAVTWSAGQQEGITQAVPSRPILLPGTALAQRWQILASAMERQGF